MTWDVRATDIVVYQLDSQYGNPISGKSWHILSGDLPQIPAGAYYRIDVRARNYGTGNPSSVRLVAQVIGRQTGNQGGVIYTPFSQYLFINDEVVLPHWIQMWAEPVYVRLWFDNKDLPGGNCAIDPNTGFGYAPPWPDTCRQAEVVDFALSNRHLITINLSGGGGPSNVAVTLGVTQGQGQICGTAQGATQICTTSSKQFVGPSGALATFTATPASGYAFSRFEGPGGITMTMNPFQQTLVSDGFVNAVFTARPPPLLPPPPPPVRYGCVNGQCVVDANGQYSSLTECMSACGSPHPSKYSCINGQCVPDAAGQYASLAECQAACGLGGEVCPPGTINISGRCVPIVDLAAVLAGGLGATGLYYYTRPKKKTRSKRRRRR